MNMHPGLTHRRLAYSSLSRPKRVMIGALTVLLLGGCGEHTDRGPLVSERREVDSFQAIDMAGAAKLEITVGDSFAVVVNGHERAVRRVETSVRGDTLHIKSRPRDWIIRDGNSRLTVRITLPRLESLALEGGNDVTVAGLHGGATRIEAAGAAHIQADGQLDRLDVHLTGAGHADLSRLAAVDAKVTVDGVGSVIVNPRDSLDATMNGVGAIFYTGSPRRVSTRMNGLGTIGQRDANDNPDAVPGAAPEAGQPVDPESLQLEREDPRRERIDHESDQTTVI